MAASIFDLPNLEPNEVMTSSVLGGSAPLLKEICNFIEREFDQFSKQWKYYGKQSGWVLKLFHKNKAPLQAVLKALSSLKIRFAATKYTFVIFSPTQIRRLPKTSLYWPNTGFHAVFSVLLLIQQNRTKTQKLKTH